MTASPYSTNAMLVFLKTGSQAPGNWTCFEAVWSAAGRAGSWILFSQDNALRVGRRQKRLKYPLAAAHCHGRKAGLWLPLEYLAE